jgi:hypothetical protein
MKENLEQNQFGLASLFVLTALLALVCGSMRAFGVVNAVNILFALFWLLAFLAVILVFVIWPALEAVGLMRSRQAPRPQSTARPHRAGHDKASTDGPD